MVLRLNYCSVSVYSDMKVWTRSVCQFYESILHCVHIVAQNCSSHGNSVAHCPHMHKFVCRVLKVFGDAVYAAVVSVVGKLVIYHRMLQ